MAEEKIKADRYAKFRMLGQFREYLVEGGDWKSADARREAAQGVTTKTGRWAEVSPCHKHVEIQSCRSSIHAIFLF